MKRRILTLSCLLASACVDSDRVFGEVDSDETYDDGAAAPTPEGGKGKPGEPTNEAKDELFAQVPLSEIMKLAHDAGVPCERLVVAGALAMAESGGWADSVNVNGSVPGCEAGSRDRGLWQINDCFWPAYDDACAFDPACNAEAMADISQDGASFTLWAAFNNGSYASFMVDAEAAYPLVAACNGGPAEQPAPGDEEPSQGASCDELGYVGTCLDEVAIWADDGVCWVRDCGAENKHCGLISAEEGYGCLEGPAGSTKHDCASLGYEGECAGDVLVWADAGACHYVDCASQGQRCDWAGSIGYDCL